MEIISEETNVEVANKIKIELGIEVHGLGYNRIDERKNAFDHNTANLQFLAYFEMDTLITDEQAQQLREEKPEIDWEALLNVWILKQKELRS